MHRFSRLRAPLQFARGNVGTGWSADETKPATTHPVAIQSHCHCNTLHCRPRPGLLELAASVLKAPHDVRAGNVPRYPWSLPRSFCPPSIAVVPPQSPPIQTTKPPIHPPRGHNSFVRFTLSPCSRPPFSTHSESIKKYTKSIKKARLLQSPSVFITHLCACLSTSTYSLPILRLSPFSALAASDLSPLSLLRITNSSLFLSLSPPLLVNRKAKEK